jgi:hypothetical protein
VLDSSSYVYISKSLQEFQVTSTGRGYITLKRELKIAKLRDCKTPGLGGISVTKRKIKKNGCTKGTKRVYFEK